MSPLPISTQLTVHIPTCMYRRTCANARVVSYVSRACAAIYIFTGNRIPVRDWSPRMNILSLRYMASQVSSIHLPYHNVNKFVFIVSKLPRAKFSQHLYPFLFEVNARGILHI
jgi:hypothetical protein